MADPLDQTVEHQFDDPDDEFVQEAIGATTTNSHSEFLDLTAAEAQQQQQQPLPRHPQPTTEHWYTQSGAIKKPSPAKKRKSSSSFVMLDPATPGRVVETGKEHTGRWTREEHDAFLAALDLYGKEWKKVAAKVKTRTVVQTRTHAQKYFQKLAKAGDEGARVEMGVVSEAAKKFSEMAKQKTAEQKQARLQAKFGVHKPPPPGRSQSTTAAAHLMTNLSSSGGGAGSSYQYNSAVGAQHGFGQAAAPEAAGQQEQAAYGQNTFYNAPPAPPRPPMWGSGGGKPMSIVAPDPTLAMQRGFPEPSPAACGKRKLAELAAAQMLAGVAGGTGVVSGGGDGDVTPPAQGDEAAGSSMHKSGSMGSLQIVNPEALGISHESKRRGRDGETSPTTPWDGQLEALVKSKQQDSAAAAGVVMPMAPDLGGTSSMVPSASPSNGARSPLVPPPFDSRFPHAVCGPGANRSPLHKAVCEMDVPSIQQQLSDSIGASTLHRKDEEGYLPIHSACALGLMDQANFRNAFEITKLLLGGGADVATPDSKGNTPLHWAARAGDAELANFLLTKNCPSGAQNENGDTALHWAMRAGLRSLAVVKVLLDDGAPPSILNKEFKRPLALAAEGFLDDKGADYSKNSKSKRRDTRKRKSDLLEEKRETRANLLVLSAQSRTLVLHHPECLNHIPKSEMDWEVPDRVNSILRRVMPNDSSESTGVFPYEVMVSSDFERAKLDLLSRVHSADYLGFVNDLSKDLAKQHEEEVKESDMEEKSAPPVVPFTPMVQKNVIAGSSIKQDAHSDTAFSAGSLRAARRAAGAVQHAVDCVLVGRHRNAFCVVRPPGHHAGVKGLLAGGDSCGFCIFNNVAAGALHAISDERLMCQRCAIVDIDVHHGNGTEEIVKRCHDPGKLLFFSIHLYDNDKKKNGWRFYPGTGEEDDIAHNIINVPITPMWREQSESKEVPSSPDTQMSGSRHNTRHQAKRRASGTGAYDGSDMNLSQDDSQKTISDTESDSVSTYSVKSKLPDVAPRRIAGGRESYRKAIQNRLLPALRAFNPDLILMSTGFDAAKGDVGNAKHQMTGEKPGLDLQPEDYAWVTRKIMEIADICCHGRVVSVLEGGYGRSAVASADATANQTLDKAMFSECAIRHLQAMIDPYDAEQRFKNM